MSAQVGDTITFMPEPGIHLANVERGYVLDVLPYRGEIVRFITDDDGRVFPVVRINTVEIAGPEIVQ